MSAEPIHLALGAHPANLGGCLSHLDLMGNPTYRTLNFLIGNFLIGNSYLSDLRLRVSVGFSPNFPHQRSY